MFEAHRLVYHSTLGWIVVKKKQKKFGVGGVRTSMAGSWRSLSGRAERVVCAVWKRVLGFEIEMLGITV